MDFTASTLRRALTLCVVATVPLAACRGEEDGKVGAGLSATSASSDSAASVEPTETEGSTTEVTTTEADADDGDASTFWDSSTVHDLSISFDQDAYDVMIETYKVTEDKEWIEGSVTIDGVTYDNVGLRLKGNSSLRGLAGDGGFGGPTGSVSEDEPESLPWLIRLDKFVDGQNHLGATELVVRANNSASSLNEAVALELVGLAGLATQQAVPTRFTVNGGDAVLRLTIENPNDDWQADNFSNEGLLYKAEAGGDWSYRGDDPEAYTDVFDQESGDANLTPLIEFLDFLNNSDDTTFATELPERLDVDAFATYLAVQELVNNFDDIDGPGNNSYLAYDSETEQFTVVNWDLNLAFGGLAGGEGGPQGGFPGRPDRTDGTLPEDGFPAGGPGGPGGAFGGMSNVLVDRFLANEEFSTLYEQRLDELTDALYASGAAQDILDRWVTTLEEHATDLIDVDTIASEAGQLESQFS